MLWLAFFSSAYGQSSVTGQLASPLPAVAPNFVPAGKGGSTTAPAGSVVPVTYQPAGKAAPTTPRGALPFDEGGDYVRLELPGPQKQFMRESQAQFYDRVRQDLKRQPGSPPAVFPEEPIISKESYVQPPYPRLDPVTKMPFAHMAEQVEPCYVCHCRLLFEQPNFERIGWDFGFIQPGLCLGVFYYDIMMMPYHIWTDPKDHLECNIGKCLPGDQAPLLLPIERYSVTGMIGEAGAIIGGIYLFP